MVDCYSDETTVNDYSFIDTLANDPTVVICLSSTSRNAMQSVRRMFTELMNRNINNPVVLITDSGWQTPMNTLFTLRLKQALLVPWKEWWWYLPWL